MEAFQQKPGGAPFEAAVGDSANGWRTCVATEIRPLSLKFRAK